MATIQLTDLGACLPRDLFVIIFHRWGESHETRELLASLEYMDHWAAFEALGLKTVGALRRLPNFHRAIVAMGMRPAHARGIHAELNTWDVSSNFGRQLAGKRAATVCLNVHVVVNQSIPCNHVR